MGVPGLYRTLFQKYNNIYKWVTPGGENIDYLYLDFNPIVYVCLFNLCEEGKLNELTPTNEIERIIIEEVIKVTQELVNVLVQPKKMLYIALDGPAPKCKLVLQRARRYKGILERKLKAMIQSKYPNGSKDPKWSKSNITPGTRFMHSLNIALQKAINQGLFKVINVILNDSSVVGEGEHKITDHIRGFNFEKNDKICVYSNDGDLIILGCQFPDKNLLIITNPSYLPKNVVQHHDLQKEYIYVDHTKFRYELLKSLGEYTCPDFIIIRNPDRILLDFMGLSFLAGNDFVKPIPFLKMRYQGVLHLLLNVYTQVVLESFAPNRYLISADGLNFDQEILSEIVFALSKIENYKMQDHELMIMRELNNHSEPIVSVYESWEEEWSDYQHICYYNPRHPDFKNYKIVPKENYYKHFLQKSATSTIEIRNVCIRYLKSLIFTLRYYTTSVPPNWRWYYPYIIAPIPSDLYTVLSSSKLNIIGQFELTKLSDYYTPFEQLMLTIPKQHECFPREYISLSKYLPTVNEIELDTYGGEKYIYAEPKLPMFNENILLQEARKIRLPVESAIRNSIKLKKK